MLRSSSLKIGLISELVGYHSIDSFNIAFKKTVGLTLLNTVNLYFNPQYETPFNKHQSYTVYCIYHELLTNSATNLLTNYETILINSGITMR